MKKYLQIIIVVSIFGVFVFLRQIWNKEGILINGNKTQQDSTVKNPIQTSLPQIQIPIPVPSSAGKIQSLQSTVTPNIEVYKNGTYTGSVADAFYGNIQIQVKIANGKITDVIFLQHPSDNNTSRNINDQAMPLLKQEAIQSQSARVDIVSGASASSQAFQQSLASALVQAK